MNSWEGCKHVGARGIKGAKADAEAELSLVLETDCQLNTV